MEPLNINQLQDFLEYKFNHVFSEINELKETLGDVKEQTTITNGSVRSLKEWRAAVEAREKVMKEVNQDDKQTSQWRIAIIVSIISTIGTIAATKIMHLF